VDGSSLAGMYVLESWHRSDGTEPFGSRPSGYLTYGRDGRVSVQIGASDRVPIGLPVERLMEARAMLRRPWKLAFNPEVIGALKRFIRNASSFTAYSGTYEIDGSTVVHHIDLASIPDWEGTDLIRGLERTETGLRLTTPEGDALVWRTA
jgi:hypothetical protein